jgi:serine O-acetyltransferase
MIQSKNDWVKYLEADRVALQREQKKPPFFAFHERDKIWKFQRIMRRCEYLKNCRKHIFHGLGYWLTRWRYNQLRIRYGFSIPLNVFGPGLCISHIGTIVINGNCRIGDNCCLHVCVNIGEIQGKAPQIGNQVYIAPGAKIFGNIEIADGIVIGANAVVNKSFLEPNTSIGGVPAKKISSQGSARFMSYRKTIAGAGNER